MNKEKNKTLYNIITGFSVLGVLSIASLVGYLSYEKTRRLEQLMNQATPVIITIGEEGRKGVDYYLWHEYKTTNLKNQWDDVRALGEEWWRIHNGSLFIIKGQNYVAPDLNHDGKIGNIKGILGVEPVRNY